MFYTIPQLLDSVYKRILPGVHFYESYTVDNLVHHCYSAVMVGQCWLFDFAESNFNSRQIS